jgi:hypothetical protein
MSASISKEDSIAPLLTVFAVNIRIYFAKKTVPMNILQRVVLMKSPI